MTKRLPLSSKQNIWHDSQQVDDIDLTLEQNYNEQVTSGIVNNNFGSGVLLSSTTENILFDSSTQSGYLDGTPLYADNQPTDSTLGNFLSLELTDSTAFGNRKVKVAIIGLDFNSNLQYETFYFTRNEVQVTKKHYTRLELILVNDLYGVTNQSFNLGGRLTISETKAVSLSRDPVMISQNVQPNIFFRDLFIVGSYGASPLKNMLISALPEYNTDNLNITTDYLKLRSLLVDDVTSQIGQKFLATTNNIQKIKLLLSVESTGSGFTWTGDLVVSIYPLQSNIACPTDLAPNLAIDFDPSNIPLAQLSFSYTTLLQKGHILDDVPQPIDFVFSNTNIANGSAIVPGKYYAITVKRSGTADNCNINLAVGNNLTLESKLTLFSGSSWIDVSEEDLWFEVYTDSVKVSDGAVYESGHGIEFPKIIQDTLTATNTDYLYNKVSFTRNSTYSAWLQAITKNSDQIQDQRTGQPVYSRKEYFPAVSLLTSTQLNSLNYSEPLLIGTVTDKNTKGFSASDSIFTCDVTYFSFVGNKIFLKVIDDIADPYYRSSVVDLKAKVLNGAVLGANIVTNTSSPALSYRVAKAQVCERVYGDINGDSLVDEEDLAEIQKLVGYDISVVPTTAEYNTLTKPFKGASSVVFTTINGITPDVSGSNGVLTIDPLDETLCNFYSPTANFGSLVDILSGKELVISSSIYSENIGTFQIYALTNAFTLVLKKKLLTKETYLKVLSADITGEFIVNSSDVTYVDNYVNKVLPIPNTTSPANKVGTKFEVIVLELESFVDRKDDYNTSALTRDTDIHTKQDIILSDSYFSAGYGFGTDVIMSFTKQLVWEDYLIITLSKTKYVPVSFTSKTGLLDKQCSLNDSSCTEYPTETTFDPGKNDIYIPNNLIIDKGNILNLDGTDYKIDFEVGTFTLELPDIDFSEEKYINIFTDLVANYSSGKTRLGYEALRFADCSLVGLDALGKDQIKFDISVQSICPLDGSILNIIGTSLDQTTGICKLFFTNLDNTSLLDTHKTRIQIVVYLKKSGFNNKHRNISSTKLINLFSL